MPQIAVVINKVNDTLPSIYLANKQNKKSNTKFKTSFLHIFPEFRKVGANERWKATNKILKTFNNTNHPTPEINWPCFCQET